MLPLLQVSKKAPLLSAELTLTFSNTRPEGEVQLEGRVLDQDWVGVLGGGVDLAKALGWAVREPNAKDPINK